MLTTAKKILTTLTVTGILIGAASGVASAHVVVQPSQVGVAAFQTFSTGVPSELDQPTVKLRIVIPAGVKHVTPTVKPGWTINEVKDGEGENATVKEITWTGGEVPGGQRDDFTFSAQVPDSPTTLQWKAYQTYADGTEVAWDSAPTAKDDDNGGPKPYSETKVVNDLAKGGAAATAKSDDNHRQDTLAVSLAVVALVLSVYSLTTARKTVKH